MNVLSCIQRIEFFKIANVSESIPDVCWVEPDLCGRHDGPVFADVGVVGRDPLNLEEPANCTFNISSYLSAYEVF